MPHHKSFIYFSIPKHEKNKNEKTPKTNQASPVILTALASFGQQISLSWNLNKQLEKRNWNFQYMSEAL